MSDLAKCIETILEPMRKEFAIHERLLGAASAAYIELLRLTPDQRARMQPVLARLRDAIADSTGLGAEQIQRSAEMAANEQWPQKQA